jgi:hypothetical protein
MTTWGRGITEQVPRILCQYADLTVEHGSMMTYNGGVKKNSCSGSLTGNDAESALKKWD